MKEFLRKQLEWNVIIRNIRRVNALLLPAERKSIIWISAWITFSAMLEIAALAFLFLMSLCVVTPDRITESRVLSSIFHAFGFASTQQFTVFMVLANFFVFMVKNAVQLFILFRQSRFTFDLATSLSKRQFLNIFSKGYESLKNSNSALLVNQILGVPSILAQGTILPMIYFFSELLLLLISLLLIFLMKPMLFLSIFLLTAPILGIVYLRTKAKLYQMGKVRTKLTFESMDKLNQSIFGFADLMLYGKGEVFLEDFLVRQRTLNNNNTLAYTLGFLPQRILEVVAIFGMLLLFFFATYFLKDQKQELIEFTIAFVFAAFRILPSLNRVVGAIMSIQNSEGNLDEFVKASEDENLLEKPNGDLLRVKQELEIRDLSFRFAGVGNPILDHVSLKIRKGEKVGIVGRSGAGKTTLVKILLRFLRETEGGIFVDGVQVNEKNRPNWRQQIGYVQQEVFIIDGTLAENIAFGETKDEIDRARVEEVVKKARLTDLVLQMPDGIDGRIGERGSKVSGGQRQRIGIARALYRNASLLIFDEATSSLDSKTEQEITESIQDLFDGERSFLIIAHRITTLKGCDRIIELGNGKVIGEYSYSEYLNRHGEELSNPS